MTVTFTVHGSPVSLNNAYANRHKGRFMVSKAKKWKDLVRTEAWCAYRGKPMMRGRLEVTMTITLANRRRFDISNVIKLIEDGMTKIIYNDDSQIDHLHVHRIIGDTEKVEITVTDLTTTAC